MTIFLPSPEVLDSPRGRRLSIIARPEPRTSDVPAHADVVVVGGGVAALRLAAALWHAGVDDVVIIDSDGRLGGRFFRRADVLGQRVLRSPYEHHPGAEGYRDCELLDFARLNWSRLTAVEKREVRMAQAGHRSVVPLDVFEAFCDHVIAVHGLGERLWRGEVLGLRPGDDEVVVHTTLGDITASSVVLCTGEERVDAPADWAAGLVDGVRYWDEPVTDRGGVTVVVGAGLSAAHLVTNALDHGGHVHWVLRKDSEHYQCADVNASFFRTEGHAKFLSTSWTDRLALLHRERVASVMFEFRPGLEAAAADGRLVIHRGTTVSGLRSGTVELGQGTAVEGDRVLLALGTKPNIGLSLLPVETVRPRDGWPDLDGRTLAFQAAPRVHALGAATCMALGPAARNIDGHRVGTTRVVGSILAQVGGVEHAHA